MNEIVGAGRGWGSGAGRQKGTPNKKTAIYKEKTKQFFARILDDEVEAKFWRHFMTGFEIVPVENGGVQLVPIPLDPVAFQAFKRAVEYKRGMPVQLVEHSGENGEAFKIKVEFKESSAECQQ